VHDLVETSWVAGDIVQGEAAGAAMRDFMFAQVYLGTHGASTPRSSGS
jgi:hypothetical protein